MPAQGLPLALNVESFAKEGPWERTRITPRGSAPRSGLHASTLLKFLIWVAVLAAAVWFIGSVVGGELGSAVTGWFRNW